MNFTSKIHVSLPRHIQTFLCKDLHAHQCQCSQKSASLSPCIQNSGKCESCLGKSKTKQITAFGDSHNTNTVQVVIVVSKFSTVQHHCQCQYSADVD